LRKWQWTDTGMKVINGTNVLASGGFDVNNTNRFIGLDEFNTRYSHFAVEPNDIVVVSSGSIGKVSRVRPDDLPLMMNTSVIRFHSADRTRLDDGYLYAYLRSPLFQNQATAFAIGSAQLNFGPVHIKQMEMPLPPISVQRKVATILSAYDDLIENNSRRIKILEEMARRIYREWFVDYRYPGHEDIPMVASELGPIPHGWHVGAFTDVADVLSGGTPRTATTEYWNGDIPFFTPRDAPDTMVATSTDKHLTQAGLDHCNSHLYPAGTVFVTARGTVGKVAMAGVAMAVNQSCYAVRGRDGVRQEFVLLSLLNQVDYLKTNTGGATFATIIVDTFSRMRAVIPPLSLISAFTTRTESVVQLIHRLVDATWSSRATSQLLLPRLISGEVDVSKGDIRLPDLVA
jgi:type I restriction enzyme S subunit